MAPESVSGAAPKLVYLRRIAWRHWDPIRLRSAQPDGDDEYDAYMFHVVAMLSDGKSPAEAESYLQTIEAEHMGLGRRAGAADRAEVTVAAIDAYRNWLAQPLRRIELDASGWSGDRHLWTALLSALGAPAWHGRNYDALWDTVTEHARYGVPAGNLINRVQAPFEIVVFNAGSLPAQVAKMLEDIASLLAEAKEEFDLPVSLTIQPGSL